MTVHWMAEKMAQSVDVVVIVAKLPPLRYIHIQVPLTAWYNDADTRSPQAKALHKAVMRVRDG